MVDLKVLNLHGVSPTVLMFAECDVGINAEEIQVIEFYQYFDIAQA